jgi:HEAT repeat protein
MADETLKKLIALITKSDSPSVRRAAVIVAGAIKPTKDRALNDAVSQLLESEDGELRRVAVVTLGELKAEETLPRLVQFVEAGGAEVEAAVQAVGHMGARGSKALGEVMHRAPIGLRRRIAAALALAGTDSAVLATAQSLLDEDASVVNASAKSLASEVPKLASGKKRILADHLMDLLNPKRPSLSAVSEAAVVRVLAALQVPEAEDAFWARLDSHRSLALRSAALQALGNVQAPSSEAKLGKLFACAADTDFQVVAPALMLLKKAPPTKKNVRQWLGLFAAPDVAAHLLAVEKLREVDTPAVAEALIRQLQHPDKGLRESALAALSELKSGRQALYDALLAASSADQAWALARAQPGIAEKWTSDQTAAVFSLASKYFEADDRRADALWFLLRETNADALRDNLVEQALALRKKKKHAESFAYWRLLTRDPAVGPDLRFELAATALNVSNHDPAATAREGDTALLQFSRLLQDADFDLFGHLKKAKWLEAEDLFYLGFHFAGQPRLAGAFGRQVLELVIERWPKTTEGKNAKHKLKSEGLG